ncbi:MAG: purine-nucleoside phosphorylase [Candidatus Krumholzibacteriota bacterium]|nr:purine-nucleoside phosphorylase [Candidatus Krumholzibacteriota bacterium]
MTERTSMGRMQGRAELAVVLGSGLAPPADAVEIEQTLSYADVPGLEEPAVEGHAGEILLLRIGGRRVLFFSGRVHRYEGRAPNAAESVVEAAAFFGCRRVLLTQAAGSLRRGLPPGSWLLATDVVFFPFGGAVAGDRGGEPIICPGFRREVAEAADAAGVPVSSGVLCWTTGPAYETPAEARAAAAIGADAATMSALPELLAARRRGLRAACLGRITNFTANVSGEETDHGDVLRAGRNGAAELLRVVSRIAAR